MTTPEPSAAGGATPGPSAAAPTSPRTAGSTAAVALTAGAALLLGGLAGTAALVAVVLAVQALLVASAVSCLVPSWRLGPVVVGAAAALGGTVAVLPGGERPLGRLAGVLGLSLVGAVLLELARRDRSRVTAALTVSLSAATLGVAVASLVALRVLPDGRALVVVAGAALALAVPLRAVVGALAGVPAPVAAGVPVLVALAAGALLGLRPGAPGPGGGLLLAAAVAVTALAAERLVARSALPPRWAVPLLAGLLPVAVAGPVAYLVGRAVAG